MCHLLCVSAFGRQLHFSGQPWSGRTHLPAMWGRITSMYSPWLIPWLPFCTLCVCPLLSIFRFFLVSVISEINFIHGITAYQQQPTGKSKINFGGDVFTRSPSLFFFQDFANLGSEDFGFWFLFKGNDLNCLKYAVIFYSSCYCTMLKQCLMQDYFHCLWISKLYSKSYSRNTLEGNGCVLERSGSFLSFS